MRPRENNQKGKRLGKMEQINRRQQTFFLVFFFFLRRAGWKEGGLLLLFFVSQCLGSVLCGEIHCRLLTCCFFIFSVWAPVCVCVCVCVFECVYGKARGRDLPRWKMKSGRKIRRERGGNRGRRRRILKTCFEFKKERKINSNMFFLCPGAVLRTREALLQRQKADGW